MAPIGPDRRSAVATGDALYFCGFDLHCMFPISFPGKNISPGKWLGTFGWIKKASTFPGAKAFFFPIIFGVGLWKQPYEFCCDPVFRNT